MSNDVITLLAVDIKVGDLVAVFADVNGECCKGKCDRFEGERVFVGNGRFVMERLEVFKRDPSTIRCVGVSIRCAGVSVRCVGVSVRCVGVSIRCVGVSVRCVGVSVSFTSIGSGKSSSSQINISHPLPPPRCWLPSPEE